MFIRWRYLYRRSNISACDLRQTVPLSIRMRAIELTDDLVEYVPKASATDVPRLAETAERLEYELNGAAWETLNDYKRASDRIAASSRTTENRLTYLEAVHKASDTYWTIVTTTVVSLAALKILQGGVIFINWARKMATPGKKKKGEAQSQISKRSHARDWKIID